MPGLTISMTTAASTHVVWDLLKAVEDFSNFMDEVQEVVVHPPSADEARVTTWSVLIEDAVLEWTQKEEISERDWTLSFEQIEGDLSQLSGVWSLQDLGLAGTRMTLEVEFDIGVPLLSEVIDPIAVRALRENFRRILERIDDYCCRTKEGAELAESN